MSIYDFNTNSKFYNYSLTKNEQPAINSINQINNISQANNKYKQTNTTLQKRPQINMIETVNPSIKNQNKLNNKIITNNNKDTITSHIVNRNSKTSDQSQLNKKKHNNSLHDSKSTNTNIDKNSGIIYENFNKEEVKAANTLVNQMNLHNLDFESYIKQNKREEPVSVSNIKSSSSNKQYNIINKSTRSAEERSQSSHQARTSSANKVASPMKPIVYHPRNSSSSNTTKKKLTPIRDLDSTSNSDSFPPVKSTNQTHLTSDPFKKKYTILNLNSSNSSSNEPTSKLRPTNNNNNVINKIKHYSRNDDLSETSSPLFRQIMAKLADLSESDRDSNNGDRKSSHSRHHQSLKGGTNETKTKPTSVKSTVNRINQLQQQQQQNKSSIRDNLNSISLNDLNKVNNIDKKEIIKNKNNNDSSRDIATPVAELRSERIELRNKNIINKVKRPLSINSLEKNTITSATPKPVKVTSISVDSKKQQSLNNTVKSAQMLSSASTISSQTAKKPFEQILTQSIDKNTGPNDTNNKHKTTTRHPNHFNSVDPNLLMKQKRQLENNDKKSDQLPAYFASLKMTDQIIKRNKSPLPKKLNNEVDSVKKPKTVKKSESKIDLLKKLSTTQSSTMTPNTSVSTSKISTPILNSQKVPTILKQSIKIDTSQQTANKDINNLKENTAKVQVMALGLIESIKNAQNNVKIADKPKDKISQQQQPQPPQNKTKKERNKSQELVVNNGNIYFEDESDKEEDNNDDDDDDDGNIAESHMFIDDIDDDASMIVDFGSTSRLKDFIYSSSTSTSSSLDRTHSRNNSINNNRKHLSKMSRRRNGNEAVVKVRAKPLNLKNLILAKSTSHNNIEIDKKQHKRRQHEKGKPKDIIDLKEEKKEILQNEKKKEKEREKAQTPNFSSLNKATNQVKLKDINTNDWSPYRPKATENQFNFQEKSDEKPPTSPTSQEIKEKAKNKPTTKSSSPTPPSKEDKNNLKIIRDIIKLSTSSPTKSSSDEMKAIHAKTHSKPQPLLRKITTPPPFPQLIDTTNRNSVNKPNHIELVNHHRQDNNKTPKLVEKTQTIPNDPPKVPEPTPTPTPKQTPTKSIKTIKQISTLQPNSDDSNNDAIRTIDLKTEETKKPSKIDEPKVIAVKAQIPAPLVTQTLKQKTVIIQKQIQQTTIPPPVTVQNPKIIEEDDQIIKRKQRINEIKSKNNNKTTTNSNNKSKPGQVFVNNTVGRNHRYYKENNTNLPQLGGIDYIFKTNNER
jgi:hypothetical protein